MKLFDLKLQFYKYISKAEYTMALTIIVGSIGTNIINSYSNYLSDRNARIERLNKQPLNYIRVDFIDDETYQRMIDRRNWRPISERIAEEKLEQEKIAEQGTFGYKKNELIKSVNGWLASKAKKENTNDEIDEEVLRKMQAEDKNFIGFNKTDTAQNVVNAVSGSKTTSTEGTGEAKQQKDYELIRARSKISELTNGGVNSLPPMKKQVEKQRYFVVRECKDCQTNRVLDVRLSRKKQNISVIRDADKPVVGQIGSQSIRKDGSIFDSIGRIWRAVLHITNDDKGVIIDSRYDQYGNRIEDVVEVKQSRKQKKKTQKDSLKDADYEVLEVEFEEDEEHKAVKYNDTLADVPSVNSVNSNNTPVVASGNIPQFTIDGSLQEMDKYNKFDGIATNNNRNATDLQMLAYLEYAFENCWYGYAKKYRDLDLSVSFVVNYKSNGELLNLEQISADQENEFFSSFKDDVIAAISRCNISRVKYLSDKNHNLWKKMKLTFTGAQ